MLEEGGGGGPRGGAAREGDEEAGAQEDGEDAQVLGGVVDADVLMPCTEGVLDARAEVVWSWHFRGESEGGPGRGRMRIEDAFEFQVQSRRPSASTAACTFQVSPTLYFNPLPAPISVKDDEEKLSRRVESKRNVAELRPNFYTDRLPVTRINDEVIRLGFRPRNGSNSLLFVMFVMIMMLMFFLLALQVTRTPSLPSPDIELLGILGLFTIRSEQRLSV